MALMQLDPMLPVHTPAGTGFAFLVIDYSQEHFLHFAVALDANGEIHIFDNREIRFTWNTSLGRPPIKSDKSPEPAAPDR